MLLFTPSESSWIFMFFSPYDFFSCSFWEGSRVSNQRDWLGINSFWWDFYFSFVLRSFLVFLRYSFLIFSSISICLMVSASNIPRHLNFLSSKYSDAFLISLFYSFRCFFFLLSVMHVFQLCSYIQAVSFLVLLNYWYISVVFWLANTSSSNNKTNHDMWGK